MKKLYLRQLLNAILLVSPCLLQAQTSDSTVHLPEFNLREKRLHYFSAGNLSQPIDSMVLRRDPSASLSTLLQNTTTLQVDAYGAGSASVSARGMGPKRTPIIWNGFNLQSVTGHDVDVSAIPAIMVDRATIETGSQSALFGSGAAGGIVYLESVLGQDALPNAQALLSVGSFGRYMGASSVRFGHSNYKGAIKIYTDKADNDFDYQADYIDAKTKVVTHIDTTQTNAGQRQYGAMSDNSLSIGKRQTLKINLWYHETERQIAPTVKDIATKKPTDARQNDKNYRTALQWNYRQATWDLAVRTGYFTSQTDYAKPVNNDKSTTNGETWQNEAEVTWFAVKNVTLNGGLHHSYESAHSTSYNATHYRNREAAFGSARYFAPVTNTRLTANARVELVDVGNYEPTFTVGVDQSIWGPLSFIAKGGTSYRVPTFNDLYWVSAYAVGNPNLKPEHGNNLEGGLKLQSEGKWLKTDAAVTAYTMHMENWMSWGKDENDVYTVLNQDSANINGIESHLEVQCGKRNKSIALRAAYAYTDARDPKTEKYLPYVPMHKTNVTLTGHLKTVNCWVTNVRTSNVYTNAGNSDELKDYSVLNAGLSNNFGFGKNSLAITALVNNIGDVQYQTRQYYPMPGRFIQLSAALTIH